MKFLALPKFPRGQFSFDNTDVIRFVARSECTSLEIAARMIESESLITLKDFVDRRIIVAKSSFGGVKAFCLSDSSDRLVVHSHYFGPGMDFAISSSPSRIERELKVDRRFIKRLGEVKKRLERA